MTEPLVTGINTVYLYVSYMERSLSFYRDTLGLPFQAEDQHWNEVRLPGGFRFALHLAPEGVTPQVPGTIYVNFEVPGIDDAADRLRGAGIEVGEIYREEYGSFFTAHDPDGYGVELFQPPGG